MALAWRLHEKISALREELHKVQTERDFFRDLHALSLKERRQAEEKHAEEIQRLQSTGETLELRHRSYKLLVEYYTQAALPFNAATFLEQRRRLLQHLIIQKQKGVSIARVSVDEIAFLFR